MKMFLWSILVSLALACHAAGWIHVEPADHAKQLASSDFAGIVEVTSLADTGRKKVMFGNEVAFREVKVTLKVLSPFKGGKDGQLDCMIYRRPTDDELIADGMPRKDVLNASLNLATDESLHLFLVAIRRNERLMAYLVKSGDTFVPVTGDEKASQSLHRLEMANQLSVPEAGEEKPGPVER
ncbi:hypothetical protein OKA05_20710 [Luteolibacter arcticus]|uniref:Uncharacterized protein n=1 Tax=Luteolibacter arcticus TaxID=1581411 RepID=A0ABT3GNA4_9BACT|nr:hypothetical protein [Luteolibacter arcticus]MCW1924997.1 hypothetical protein [Luteolibacter arcticus]